MKKPIRPVMVTVNRKYFDRFVKVTSLIIFVASVLLAISIYEVKDDIKFMREELDETTQKLGTAMAEVPPPYLVLVTNKAEAARVGGTLAVNSPKNSSIQTTQRVINRDSTNPLFIYFIYEFSKMANGKTTNFDLSFPASRLGSLDSAINKYVPSKIDPSMQSVIIADGVAGKMLINELKDSVNNVESSYLKILGNLVSHSDSTFSLSISLAKHKPD